MKPLPHPSFYIHEADAKVIREYAAAAEEMNCLHAAQLAVIYKNKWFNLFVPKIYAGLGLPLPEGLKIEEAVAWADGCAGWTVTLCSGANWFVGFLQQNLAATLFSNEKVCLAGSGRSSGIAKVINENEFEISGSWQYATGAAHATAFTANCLIEKDGHILKDEDGGNLIAAFVFLRSEVSIREDWKAIGMKATSSNSFSVRNLRVGKNRSFMIDESKAVLFDKIYQYPFLQFAENTLAVNISGMSIHFMDLVEHRIQHQKLSEYFTKDRRNRVMQQIQSARGKQQAMRGQFYQMLERSWNVAAEKIELSSIELNNLSIVSRQLALISREVVDALYPFCGLTGADPDSEINRVWRDLHTAILHPLLLSN